MLFLFLQACTPNKSEATAADTADDSASAVPGPDPVQPTLVSVGSVGIGGLNPSFAGYSFAGVEDGFAWTATATGIVYVCAPTAIGEVADICEARWSGQEWSIDKMARDGARLSVADAAGAGIAYTVEDTSAGTLEDVYVTRVEGAYPDGYAGTSLHFDADLDGDEDDLAVTTSLDGSVGWSASPDYYGEIAVFLNATSGAWLWSEADYLLPSCADGGVIAFGPTTLVSDGTVLYAGCPAASYGEGAVEGWALPVSSRPADWQVLGPSGWYMSGRVDDGVFVDGRRDGVIYSVQTDGDRKALSLEGDESLDGTAPSVLRTAGGRVLLAYGSQSQTSTGFAPEVRVGAGEWPWQLRTLNPGTPGPQAADGGFYGAVTVCDISGGWYTRLCTTAELPDDGFSTCTGAVQALVEIDGEIYVGSSGWVYGVGTGCGATTWRVDLPE